MQTAGKPEDPNTPDTNNDSRGPTVPAPTYWLTRFIILRLLGFVYFIAFLAAANQIVPLVGQHGLLPARTFLNQVASNVGSRSAGFLEMPTLFWANVSDGFLVVSAWIGVALSLMVTCGYANAILMALLWGLYMSFANIGQLWYGYGWEIQLLETGFLAIFLCPLWEVRPFAGGPPHRYVIWLFRWLIFRIMIGAGLIKLRGDPCWRDLTCLYYHYETQPIPNPLSWWLHFRPHWFHKLGVLWNHLVELVVPWFAFGPRLARHIAGALLVLFQISLILSGNLSFLNWLTAVPALACFDDSLLKRWLPGPIVRRAERAMESAPLSPARERVAMAVAGLVALLSINPVINLLSPGQVMNTSFNRLHLVNTYGAFGSVGQVRFEIVFEGTEDANLTPQTVWKEYEFKAKPGDPRRRPAIIAPYQPRIDWQIWFAAMSTPDQYPWTLHFIWKLLHNDAGTLSLLANNPFPNRPPRYIRAQYYRYQFAPPGDPSGVWWKRTLEGTWLPALSAEDPRLLRVLAGYGWLEESR
ncbi:MAG TPA: lipase maturation factor family protein [Methylomirabilota bacterium]|nr:lipase maturation factor family protein [Methylomirabilota bacterium]